MPKELKCKCPQCGCEFTRPPFDRTSYQRELMKRRRGKKVEKVRKPRKVSDRWAPDPSEPAPNPDIV